MSVYSIYFSPTKSTENIVKLISNEFEEHKEIDLSVFNGDYNYSFNEDDICIIGVPSYGGRVPNIALERMKNFNANKAKAIAVVVYGNRAYDDTLLELTDFLSKQNFSCIAGITAIAEHSMMHQFAKGRPDDIDKKQLLESTQTIISSIKNTDSLHVNSLNISGNYPYIEFKGVALKPQTNDDCSKCGVCAKLCPMGAISKENPEIIDKDKCITCMRCISICPKKAKNLDNDLLEQKAKLMEKLFAVRKENELFI